MAASRPIWLCADDYGMSPAVNIGIRQLIAAGRLNATSVMVVAPTFTPAEAAALELLNADVPRAAIGLHLTLTAPFRPLADGFSVLRDGSFLPVGDVLRAAVLRRFRHDAVVREVAAQVRAFTEAFGEPPRYIDGHQHVQLFPQIRDAVLQVASKTSPDIWVRQCGRVTPRRRRLRDRKGLLLDILSVRFRRRAQRLGVRTNSAFAGTYDFMPDADFGRLFPSFLKDLPADGLVMCHPGFVDAELERLDPLTTLREREYAYLAGDDFPKVMNNAGVTLARATR